MEAFWKEYTITLPSKKEYVFDIRNKKTNCVFLQNYNITNVRVGVKPHSYETEIPPNQTSIINRPFPIKYVYLFTDKQTSITIVETVTQNPIGSFIQQEVTKNVSIETVNTIIQNTPLEICQLNAFRPQVRRRLVWPPYRHRTEFIYDLGSYGAPTINILVFCGRIQSYFTRYRIFGFNENTGYIKFVDIQLPRITRGRYIPPALTFYSDNVKLNSISTFHALLTLSNNTFKYLSLIGTNMPFHKPGIVKSIR
jgi:hypothetical protein